MTWPVWKVPTAIHVAAAAAAAAAGGGGGGGSGWQPC